MSKKVWVVGISNCESDSIVAICTTKEIAERELFKAKDSLVKKWTDVEVWQEKRGVKDDMYSAMIKNLTSNDYEKWDNYPHERPYLYETEIVDE